jgi:hypothetical protein
VNRGFVILKNKNKLIILIIAVTTLAVLWKVFTAENHKDLISKSTSIILSFDFPDLKDKKIYYPHKTVLKDKKSVSELLKTLEFVTKDMCACEHSKWVIFINNDSEVRSSICDHCFIVNFNDKSHYYEMPKEFYTLFEKYKKEYYDSQAKEKNPKGKE